MRKEIKVKDKIICYEHGIVLCGKVEKITPFRPCAFSSRTAKRINIAVEKTFPNHGFTYYDVVDDEAHHVKVCHYKKSLWLKLREHVERRRMVDAMEGYRLLGKIHDILTKAREV